uniref:Uncharacterized protein n=1 Tax=Mycena chlorophos TaxID=658473 RepID=A0ABQ0LX20_MYCCL|nr:predicted protein [Mycena chlorophos]
MNPLLETSKIRFLPGKIKLYARALVDGVGTEADYDGVLQYISRESVSLAFIHYTLPDIANFDPTTASLGFRSLKVLLKPRVFSAFEDASDELWPGAWRWMLFISTFGSTIPGLGQYLDLDNDIFVTSVLVSTKFHRLYEASGPLLAGCETPEAVYIFTRGWTLLSRASRDYVEAMECIQMVLSKNRLEDNPDRIPSLVEGAHGPAGLATLFIDTLRAFLLDLRRAPGEWPVMRENLSLVQMMRHAEPGLLSSDPSDHRLVRKPSAFMQALISGGAIELLSEAALFYFAIAGGSGAAHGALALIAHLITFPNGYFRARLTGATLVRAVIGLVTTLPSAKLVAPVAAESASALAEFYFVHILPVMIGDDAFMRDARLAMGPDDEGSFVLSSDEPSAGPGINKLIKEESFKSWCSEHPGVWEPLFARMKENLWAKASSRIISRQPCSRHMVWIVSIPL